MKCLSLATILLLGITDAINVKQIGQIGTELVLNNGPAVVEIGKRHLSEASRVALTYAQPIGSKAMEIAFESGPKYARLATDYAAHNPAATSGTVLGVVTAGVGLTVLAAPALVSAPCLAAAGFGSNIVAGSYAAVTHSTIGNAVAGSLFSTLQSAGAGGYGLAVVNGVVQVGATALTAVGSGLTFKARL